MDNRYMKRYSAASRISEMRVETTMRYHDTPTGVVKSAKTGNIKTLGSWNSYP